MLLETLVALVDAIANRAPTIVCLQDLHWVDPSTADLVREMATALSAPVLTICNFRPGFELGAPGEQVLQLTELTRHHTFDQLVSLLDGADPPDELVSVVIERAEGNPFFVEEIVNSLIETGVLVREAGGWALRKQLDEVVVPSTIRGLIASRIDNLDPDRRRVLREVSVVGREFLYRLVRDVSTTPDELDGSLAELAAADLIREKSTDPELEYIFKHALTQEVAYEGLVRRERQDLHQRVAHAIESVLGDRTGEYVETLAYHYQRSGHVSEAVDYLRRAGRKALDRYAIAEADAHYRSAYELLTTPDPDRAALDAATHDRLLLEVILDWFHVHYYACSFTEMHQLQVLHPDLPARVGDDALLALWLGWSGQAALSQHDIDGSAAVLDEAITVGQRSGDPTSQGYALVWQMWTLANFGQSERAVTLWPQVEALLSGITDPYARRYAHIKGLGGLAYAANMRGDTVTARAMVAELLEIGARTGNRRASAMGHISLSSLHLSLGNRPQALAEAVAARDAEADTIYALLANVWFTGINANWGDADQVVATIDEWRPVTVRLELAQFTTWFDFFRGISAIKSGQLSRGIRDIDGAREQFTRGHNEWGLINVDVAMAQIYRQIATGEATGKASDALRNPGFVFKHARGAAKRARVALETLAATVEARGFGHLQPAVQLELAKLAIHERRDDDARTHLERTLALLAHEPDATYACEAAALLESR
jgi:tetratricopeptide (TPR) repeat protein